MSKMNNAAHGPANPSRNRSLLIAGCISIVLVLLTATGLASGANTFWSPLTGLFSAQPANAASTVYPKTFWGLAAGPMAPAAPMANGLLVVGSMSAIPVPCTEIDVSWANASASNTYADLYRSVGPTFDQASAVVARHFQGNDKNLLAGAVTFTDTGLALGQAYSYRITSVKVTGGNTTTESLTVENIMLQAIECLSVTAVAPSATPNNISVGTGGTIQLSATVTKVSGPGTDPISGTVLFTVFNTSNVSVSQTTGTINPATGIATSSFNANLISNLAGSYSILADYSGDTIYNAASASTAVAVGLAQSSTSVTSSMGTSIYGDSVTFTATVDPVGPPTPGGVVKFYDGPTCGGPQIGTDQTLSGTRTAAVSTSSLSRGTHTVTACYQGSGAYSASSNSTVQTVTPKALTVTGVTANSRVYDATTSATLNVGSAALSGVVGTDNVVLSTAGATGSFANKNVGASKPVTTSGFTISGLSANNYTLTQPTPLADITPFALTATVTAASRVYNGTTIAAINSCNLATIFMGDVVTCVVGSANFDNANVGAGKTVTAAVTLGSADAGNYSLPPTANALADITPASLTATITAADKTYDGNTAATITNCSLTGVVSGQTVTCSGTGATFDTANAGTGKTVTANISLGGADFANYFVAPTAATTANINKAAAVISVVGFTGTYDAMAHGVISSSATGVNSEALTGLVIGPETFTNVPGGNVSWTFTNPNYADQNGSAAVTINKASSTTVVTFEAAPYVYRGTAFTATASVTGVGGLNSPVTVVYSGDCTNVTITNGCTGTATFAATANHLGSSDAKSITVTARSATWTTAPASKTYGNADPIPLTTGSGNFLAADGVTATYSRAPGETVAGGPYAITATLSPAGVLSNYNITNAGASFTITARNATWTTTPASKTYGNADPVPLTTGSGNFLAADGVTATYSRAPGETVAGGPYAITATLSPAGVLSNYNITNAGASFTITARNATWTTTPASKTYGNADPLPLTTGSGNFLATDSVTATYSRVAGETVAGGPYAITATLSPAGVLSNYNITNAGAAFTITARNATWTTTPVSKTYGNADPVPLTTGSGNFLAADGVTATYSRAPGETVAGGPYAITATLSPAGVLSNYNITNAGAAFTINARNATWTTTPASKTYGDADPMPLTTGSGNFLAADSVTATYSRAPGETVAGGPYAITATLSPAGVLSNYNITNAGAAFTITARNATWTTTPASKTYGDADPMPLTTGSGNFLAVDSVTATYSRAPGETVAGGPYAITATLSPAGVLSNYNITNAGAAFTITRAAVTATAGSGTAPFDGVQHAPSACTVSGPYTVGFTCTNNPAMVGPAPGVYTITPVPNDTANFDVTPVNGSFEITSRTIAGSVQYSIVPNPVAGVLMSGDGSVDVSATTEADGTYLIGGFNVGPYVVTPSKTAQACSVTNGIFASDASLVARHVVGLETLTGDALSAAKVSGLPVLSSYDAGLIARRVVGLCADPVSFAGEWRFTPANKSYTEVVTNLAGENYTAYMMGDIDGNWNPAGANRPALLRDNPNAIQASLSNVAAQPGTVIEVPLSISNLNGAGVGAYQFDIEYDPSVVEPAQAAADVTGTISSSLAVAFNTPRPGLLKVAVYGAIPATGDGTYVNLRFNTIGGVGSSSPLTISEFIINSGTEAISVTNGRVTVSGPAGNSSTLTGRLLTATGRPVAAGSVTLVGSNRAATRTVAADAEGRFQFGSLTLGETYTVMAKSRAYRFTPVTVSITAAASELDLIAEPVDAIDEP